MLVKGGRVISTGYNKYVNPPHLFPDKSPNEDGYSEFRQHSSIHAEIDAIRGVDPEIVRGATIYVARVTHGGGVGLSRPCENCTNALIDAGVRKVVYTDNDYSKLVEV